MKKIIVIYPQLFASSGDGGNAEVLAARLNWRGIAAEIVQVEPGQPVPQDGLVYVLGGLEDLAAVKAVEYLRADGGLEKAATDGAVILGVNVGYQLLGNSFQLTAGGETHQGLGLLDVTSKAANAKIVGEILTVWRTPDASEYVLTGFENHFGTTTLGEQATPLARVERGDGNDTSGTAEGAVQGRVFGTYLHGPLLARNPKFVDYLLELGLGEPLPALEHPTVGTAHEQLRARRLEVARTTKDLAQFTR